MPHFLKSFYKSFPDATNLLRLLDGFLPYINFFPRFSARPTILNLPLYIKIRRLYSKSGPLHMMPQSPAYLKQFPSKSVA
jgi:hypothetical protein